MTCTLEKLIKNIEGRMRVEDDHAAVYLEKGCQNMSLYEAAVHKARFYSITLDVLREIQKSGELEG